MAGKKPDPERSAKSKLTAVSGGDSECDITIDCDLTGVRPAVLASISKGDRLAVRIEPGEPYRSVVCETTSGAIVGAISAFPGHGKLMTCLDRGVTFEVAVQEVGAGRCHVVGGLVQ